jgi:twitching motility protein PilT
MAQLDKLLSHTAARGGVGLTLEPGQQPMLRLPDGREQPLLANALPSTLLEVLAQEAMPRHLEDAWRAQGSASFDHQAGDTAFRLTFTRGSAGVRIQAGTLGTQAPAARPAPAIPGPLAPAAPFAQMELLPIQPVPVPSRQPRPVPPLSVPPLPVPGWTALPEPGSGTARPEARLDSPRPCHAMAESLFTELLARKGSDLHCSSFEAPIVRVNGDMEELSDFGILGPNQLMEIMEAIAPESSWRRYQDHHDADFAYAFEAGNCRLRVNLFRDRVGPGLVCRVIPSTIPDPDQLGLEMPVKRLAMLSKGLVLVTGPTGSGKSTSLAALLDLANRQRRDHIVTIEDPIEFVHQRRGCLVNQREVGTHTESFRTGLRAALREDPDIVMVGEMRDLETIAIALETAVTGHLVFGTLHTSSAVGTIDRIVDQFPADRQQQIRVMLADSLKCVISQVLVKRTGGGRIAALESLFVTPAIANLVRESKNFQIPSAMQTGRALGQKLMNDALVELIQKGLVLESEAYQKAPDKETFMNTLKRAGIDWDPRNHE